MEYQYQKSIRYLDNVSRDGRPWQLLIFKECLPNADGRVEESAVVIYSGRYTAQIGAERAYKRTLKKLKKGETPCNGEAR